MRSEFNTEFPVVIDFILAIVLRATDDEFIARGNFTIKVVIKECDRKETSCFLVGVTGVCFMFNIVCPRSKVVTAVWIPLGPTYINTNCRTRTELNANISRVALFSIFIDKMVGY